MTVGVLYLFLMMPQVGPLFEIVAFPGHTSCRDGPEVIKLFSVFMLNSTENEI